MRIAQDALHIQSAMLADNIRTGITYELVDDHRGDTFRAVYTVRVGDAIHVLHAFQKKSKSGIGTPQPDVDLIARRMKAVLARHGRSGRQ